MTKAPRSSVLWLADIEPCVEDVRIAAREYDEQYDVQFLRDAAKELIEVSDRFHTARLERLERDADERQAIHDVQKGNWS